MTRAHAFRALTLRLARVVTLGSGSGYRRENAADVGALAIGHFGFFRVRFETTLWPQVARFLAA